MRLKLRPSFKEPEPLNTYEYRVVVYEILIDGGQWESFVSTFHFNGFAEIPGGVAVIDKETGMIRLRLASLIEEE